MGGRQRISAAPEVLCQNDRTVQGSVGHVIDVDHHPLLHHLVDQDLTEGGQAQGVAACVLIADRNGEISLTEGEQTGDELDNRAFLSQLERVAFVGALVLGRIPVAFHEPVAHLDGALPGGRTAEGVVEVVDRKDVSHAPQL